MSSVITDEFSMRITKLLQRSMSPELTHPTFLILTSFLTQRNGYIYQNSVNETTLNQTGPKTGIY